MMRLVAVGVMATAGVLGACHHNAAPVVSGTEAVALGGDSQSGRAPRLHCAPTPVAFLDSVSCALANVSPVNKPAWRFHAVDGLAVIGPSGVVEWGGPIVVGGDVIVDYFDPGTRSSVQLIHRIVVEGRN